MAVPTCLLEATHDFTEKGANSIVVLGNNKCTLCQSLLVWFLSNVDPSISDQLPSALELN